MSYKAFVMTGREPTRLNSPEPNYEVREFSGGIVRREDGRLIQDNLTNMEAEKAAGK